MRDSEAVGPLHVAAAVEETEAEGVAEAEGVEADAEREDVGGLWVAVKVREALGDGAVDCEWLGLGDRVRVTVPLRVSRAEEEAVAVQEAVDGVREPVDVPVMVRVQLRVMMREGLTVEESVQEPVGEGVWEGTEGVRLRLKVRLALKDMDEAVRDRVEADREAVPVPLGLRLRGPVAVGEAVGGEGVRVGVALGPALPVTVREGLQVRVTLAVGLRLGVVPDGVGVRVPRLGVADGVRVPGTENVRLRLTVSAELRVREEGVVLRLQVRVEADLEGVAVPVGPVMDGEWDRGRDIVRVVLNVLEEVDVGVGVRDCETLWVGVRSAVRDRVPEGEGVGDGEGEWEAGEGLREGLRVPLPVKLGDPVPAKVGVRLGVIEAEGEWDGDHAAVSEGLQVGLGVGEDGVKEGLPGLWVGVRVVAEKLQEAVDEWVGEGLAVREGREGEGVGVALDVALREPVGTRLGDGELLMEGVGVALGLGEAVHVETVEVRLRDVEWETVEETVVVGWVVRLAVGLRVGLRDGEGVRVEVAVREVSDELRVTARVCVEVRETETGGVTLGVGVTVTLERVREAEPGLSVAEAARLCVPDRDWGDGVKVRVADGERVEDALRDREGRDGDGVLGVRVALGL